MSDCVFQDHTKISYYPESLAAAGRLSTHVQAKQNTGQAGSL
jgi:hypothetical protein